MNKPTVRRICAVLLILGSFFSLYSQNTIPLPAEEAPAAFFSLGRDDPAVEIFVQGYWKAQFSASLGFAYAAGKGLLSDYAFTGMESGFDFEQHPDLTLSVWLFQRFFLEVVFSEKWDDTTFLLGYQGKPGEFLQWVRLGNRNIRINEYAYLSFPDIPDNGLGIGAGFSAGTSRHELIFRFDPAEKQEIVFRGNYQVEERYINPGAYRKGQDFILPEQNISGLEILVEKRNDDTGISFVGDDETAPGSGIFTGQKRTYRRIEPGTYSWDGELGTLSFDDPQTGSVLIRYTGGTMPSTINIPGLPWNPLELPINFLKVSVDGSIYILLFRPGEFSPLEANKFYDTDVDLSLTESWKSSLWLVPKSDLNDSSTPLPFSARDENVFSLGSGAFLPGTANYSYPLLGSGSSGVYGPERKTAEEEQENLLLLQVMTPVTEYRLEKPLEGSVRVKINGVETKRFSVSPSGVVSFPFSVSATDRIEISYYSLSSSKSGGDLLVGLGNFFQLTPKLSLELGTGFRWNVLSGTYTEKMDQNPGAILASAALHWQDENLQARLDGGFSLSTGDTTGVFRLKGMEETGFSVIISKGAVLPSGEPVSLPAPSQGNRGYLLSKDYHSYNAFGSSYLNNYDWTPPEDQVYPYQEGSRIGPYVAAAKNDGRDGQVLVIDYELRQNEWVGAQIPVGAGSMPPDLSSQQALNFSWKWDGPIPANTKVYVELGSLGEDLDGDNILDEELSALSDGFLFNDGDNGMALRYGGGQGNRGNGYKDTEDTNNNGLLDLDHQDIAKIVSVDFDNSDNSFPDAGWKYVRLPFDEAERKKLKSVSAIRVFLVNADTSAITGRLLVGDFFFEGSAFLLNTDLQGDSGVSFSETYEGQLPDDERPSVSLESAHSEVVSTFHPDGERQKILRISWNDLDEQIGDWKNRWEIKTYTRPASLSGYEELSFYLRRKDLTALPGSRFYLNFLDTAGKGLAASFPLEPADFPGWTKITVNLREKTVSANGQNLPDSRVSLDGSAGPVSVLTIGMKNTTDGLLFLDEIHLANSRLKASGGVRGSLDYTKSGALLTLGDKALIRDFSFSGSSYYSGEDFAAGIEASPGAESLGGAVSTSFGVLDSRLEFSGDINYSEGETLRNAAHRFELPFWSGRIKLSDSYSQSVTAGGKSFSRNSLFNFVPAAWMDLLLQNSTALYQNESRLTGSSRLNQSWTLKNRSLFLKKFSFTLEADFSQSLEGWRQSEEFYLAQWMDSFRYLIPQSGDQADRNALLDTEAAYNSASWGLALQARGGYSSLHREAPSGTGAEQRQKNEFLLAVKPRFSGESAPRRNWTFTPVYRRKFLWERITTHRDFSSETSAYFSSLGQYPFAFASIPLWEIYAPDVFETFREGLEGLPGDTSYIPGYSLELRRNTGSYLIDFFLPSSVTFDQDRELSRQGSVWSDLLISRLNVRFSWINLFGRLGIHPYLAKLYDSEELISIITFSREDDRAIDTVNKNSLIVQTYLHFQGKNQGSLTLDNHFSLNFLEEKNWKEQAVFSFAYQSRGERLIRLPVLKNFIESYTGLKHTETLEISFGSQNKEGIISALIKHNTSLMFSKGTLGVFIAFGLERKNTLELPLYLMGIQTGLSANFAF